MADAKLTELTEDTAPDAAGLLYYVDDPAGTPASKKATIANVVKAAAATQAEMETASSATVFASPGRTQFHPGVAKFWVAFNGSGTIGILGSGAAHYNVTSLTDNGTGDYTVTIATDFSSADWACFACGKLDATDNNGDTAIVSLYRNSNPTAGTVRLTTTFNTTGFASFDCEYVTVVGFGDQA